ncbi:CDP-alcohol phosphatidyltransferase family protein [Sulfurovum sp. TSL1]|uniref:CDP-alcohol phosphatidyltransferase family protein n=1 Tax=Sulfurovum sp. TSL1 TaxID=2826994 RepID=UPI001CC33E9C|nr:CDP-alcohol phosphatidyltransferase family protein [Sulfurovum sp. TSL1]GIT97832.1 CDP-alcohol phosphatidyltransferase [Sulfurovum sp. TSL1]
MVLHYIPNILSLFRIFAAPFLLLSGWYDLPILFFILLGMMLLSDLLDGIIARRIDHTTERGSRLDSYGDILTYLSTPLAVWWLWPDIVKEELYYIIAAIVIYIVPAIFSFLKFGQLASYHTWITKIAAVLMSVGVVMLLGFDNHLLFHSAVYFLVLVMVENIAITFILPKQKSDIYSVWHAWKERS